jgi:membrane-associated phospholipid phosphatase
VHVSGWGFVPINEFAKATPWLHGVVVAYANYGLALFAGLLLAGWWTGRRIAEPTTMAAALSAGVATLLAVALNQPIVGWVHEARPYTTHSAILVLAHRSIDFSFPSDHAVMAGAVAAGLWFVSRRLGVIATVAAVLMAFARVYIAAHYPQDVLAGLALGATVAVVAYLTVRTIAARLVTAARRTRLKPLLVTSSATPQLVEAPEVPHRQTSPVEIN